MQKKGVRAMRIDRIQVKGFRCFENSEFQFNPSFNLIIGNNQAGKTSLLEAVSVAIGAWLQGIRETDQRNLRQEDVQLRPVFHEKSGRFLSFEDAQITEVSASGIVCDQSISWSRDVKGRKGRTTSANAKKIITLATDCSAKARAGKQITLPLVSYYGTGRLWLIPKDMRREKGKRKQTELSRFEGYKNSLDKRCNPTEFIKWMQHQEWIAFQEHEQTAIATAVKDTIIGCLDRGSKIWYSAKDLTVLVEFDKKKIQTFESLSDGFRNMVSMIGDIAIKAAQLNPHLHENAIKETPGIVLIDELDLHLHPKWQRQIVQTLKRIFPRIQFICTTHSPQIIGEVQPEELIILENGHPVSTETTLGLDSNRILLEVMDAPIRNIEIQSSIEMITELIDSESFDQARLQLNLLKEKLGDNDAEIIRFESHLDFLTD
jgi:predicted ATP-binding protein involved in virulence